MPVFQKKTHHEKVVYFDPEDIGDFNRHISLMFNTAILKAEPNVDTLCLCLIELSNTNLLNFFSWTGTLNEVHYFTAIVPKFRRLL